MFSLKVVKALNCFIEIACINYFGLTPCNPMEGSLPSSSVHGISQARILEWVAISFSIPKV